MSAEGEHAQLAIRAGCRFLREYECSFYCNGFTCCDGRERVLQIGKADWPLCANINDWLTGRVQGEVCVDAR